MIRIVHAVVLGFSLIGLVAAAPAHIKTSIQDLCYHPNCYHPQTRVPLDIVARFVTWAQPDTRDLARARAAGIKTTLYTDPDIQYSPQNFAPLITNDEATFLHDCHGGRATIDDYNSTGFLMDLRSPRFLNVWDAFIEPYRSQTDAVFVDDLFAAVQYWKAYKNAPCETSVDAWSIATANLLSRTHLPVVVNNLAVRTGAMDDPRPDPVMHKALEFPNVIGGMYELCFTSDARHKDSGPQWYRAANSQIYTVSRRKLWFCFSEEHQSGSAAASLDDRLYLYASFLLGYDPEYSVLQVMYTDPDALSVFPETQFVALEPKATAHDTIESLRSQGGTYVREFGACYYRKKPLGPCATAVNPDPNVSFSVPLTDYKHTLVLHGGGIADGGNVTFDGPAPPATLPPTTAIIAVK